MKNLVLKHVLYMTKLFTYAFLIQFLFMNFLFAGNGNAQVKSIEKVMVRMSLENEGIENAFATIEKVSDFSFVYTNRDVKDIPKFLWQIKTEASTMFLKKLPFRLVWNLSRSTTPFLSKNQKRASLRNR